MFFILKLKSSGRIARMVLIFTAGFLVVAGATQFITNSIIYMSFFWLTLLIVAALLIECWRKAILMIPIYMALNIIDTLLSRFIILYLKTSPPGLIQQSDYYLVINLCAFLIDIGIISIASWIINRRQFRHPAKINHYYIGIISFGLVLILFMLIQADYIISNNFNTQLFSTLGPALFFLIYGAVCIAALYLSTKNNQYQQDLKTKETMMEWQKQYYNALLDKEIETKKFRHDISHHIYYIEQLAEKKDYSAIKDYLAGLQNHLERLKTHVETGNETMNIIIKDIFSHPDAKNITLNWKGCIPETIKIPAVDLCIIFSNLFSNAVSAVLQCADTVSKEITVSIKTTEYHLYIAIINPVAHPVSIIKNTLKTSKEHSEEHGFGTQNAARIAALYGGEIQYHYENYQFKCELFFTNIF